jgi:AraC-like DNA-binding protein
VDPSTDTFRCFVEILSKSLDEPGTTPTELSARLHLSRFHVDRLVSSVSGETPSAQRRRVLLERAAFRLVTTDTDVMTIGTEAGYETHEGFTRAFRRAYGAPPSRWRRHPNPYQLLARLVGQMAMWELAEQGASTYDIADERGLGVAEMRAWYDEVGPRFTGLVHRVSDDGLVDVTFVNTMCSPPELFTYGGLIAHVLTFAAHRRTLVCGALADAGVHALGAGDPRDWVSEPR